MPGRSLQRRLKDALRYRFFRQNWTIGVARCPIEQMAGLCGTQLQRQALESLHWMAEERGLFRADPFPIFNESDNRLRILFEQLLWSEGRGTIAACHYDGQAFGPVEPVLSLPHHLSYPFTLSHEDSWLMMPEQAEDRTLKAYDPDHPDKQSSVLISGSGLIDATVFEHAGRWWMFATHAGAQENTQLNLYHSEDLKGPWIAHAANPVKSDRGSARPAGHVFGYQGQLYRPGQNCSDHYGQSVKVHRITHLDEAAYEEEQVAEIAPPPSSPYRDGLHTLAACGPYTVIDGARLESTWHPAFDRGASLVR